MIFMYSFFKCASAGGDLLSLHDADEEKFILYEIARIMDSDSQGFWIGLNNKWVYSEE